MSSADEGVLGLSLAAFLDALADSTPTPGGGSVAALAGSLACALGRMVAAYAVKREPQAAVAVEHLERADHVLRRLANEDIAAYQELANATRQVKTDPSKSARKQEALITATLVPMEMAAAAVTALATMDEFKALAGRALISDLGAAAVVAHACAEAAAYSVLVNIRDLSQHALAADLARQISDLTGRAASLTTSVTRFVDEALQNPSR
jgi:formiminotetrahydrofolate cyclodeaminase